METDRAVSGLSHAVKSPGSQTVAAVPVGLLIGRCLVVDSRQDKALPNLSPPLLSGASVTRKSLPLLCFVWSLFLRRADEILTQLSVCLFFLSQLLIESVNKK